MVGEGSLLTCPGGGLAELFDLSAQHVQNENQRFQLPRTLSFSFSSLKNFVFLEGLCPGLSPKLLLRYKVLFFSGNPMFPPRLSMDLSVLGVVHSFHFFFPSPDANKNHGELSLEDG